MEVLLRQLRPEPDGAVEFLDSEISADVLSVGSAPACTIQLLGEGVAPRHASIRGGRDQLSIICRRGCKVALNGKPVVSAAIQVGDLVEIGGNRLRRIEPPAGFDAAIEVEANTQVAASAFEQAFRTDLSATWLTKRSAAWVLGVLVLLLGLLLPYSSIAPQRAGRSTPALLPSDHFWTAGPLIPAHELAAGKRCGSCHQQLFTHVRDPACKDCHKTIADHVEDAKRQQTSLGEKQRCAECHREHHESPSGLVIRDDHLCIDCHARSATAFGPLKVQPVTAFSPSPAHPAFTVSLIEPRTTQGETLGVTQNGAVRVDWQVRREPVASAREQSNLMFSHAQHLDPAHVTRTSDGSALDCADCHTPEPDGEHFVPVTMQHSCGTAGCHELRFDPRAPQMPHGNPRDAILLIQDYFVRRAVDPNKPVATLERRRLPDEDVQQESPCAGSPFQCALQRAQTEVENQFKTRGCGGCHNVIDTHNSDLSARFQVWPVRLTRDYFPDVNFSHRLHAVQKDKSGDAACLSCHAVKKSSSSADVFVPDLPKCLECHSERLQTDRVTLQCSSCHTYHPKTIIARSSEAEVQ